MSAQANVDVLVPSALIAPFQSSALKGDMTLAQALDRLLAGTSLNYKISHRQRVTIIANQKRRAKPVSDSPKPIKAIEEVIVTATKRATDLQKTPIAVTALTQATLNQLQAKDIHLPSDLRQAKLEQPR